MKEERGYLEEAFVELPWVLQVFPSNANFFLARVTDAVKIYNYLVGEGIIVRNRNSISLCGNCLRVTVGTRAENAKLIGALKNINRKNEKKVLLLTVMARLSLSRLSTISSIHWRSLNSILKFSAIWALFAVNLILSLSW